MEDLSRRRGGAAQLQPRRISWTSSPRSRLRSKSGAAAEESPKHPLEEATGRAARPPSAQAAPEGQKQQDAVQPRRPGQGGSPRAQQAAGGSLDSAKSPRTLFRHPGPWSDRGLARADAAPESEDPPGSAAAGADPGAEEQPAQLK